MSESDASFGPVDAVANGPPVEAPAAAKPAVPVVEAVIDDTSVPQRRMSCRPLKMTDAVKQQIVTWLATGASMMAAAKYCGCAPDSIYRTMRRDAAFADEVRKATARRELILVRRVDKAAEDPKHWRAAAWLLACTNREQYADRRPGDVSPEQMRQLLVGYAQILSDEIRDRDDRQRVMRRLNEMVAAMQTPRLLKEK